MKTKKESTGVPAFRAVVFGLLAISAIGRACGDGAADISGMSVIEFEGGRIEWPTPEHAAPTLKKIAWRKAEECDVVSLELAWRDVVGGREAKGPEIHIRARRLQGPHPGL